MRVDGGLTAYKANPLKDAGQRPKSLFCLAVIDHACGQRPLSVVMCSDVHEMRGGSAT
jgi:hypothetical protein